MKTLDEMIEGKTLEELKPKNMDVIHPAEGAMYFYKRLMEKIRINDEIDACEKRLAELRDELDALSRL